MPAASSAGARSRNKARVASCSAGFAQLTAESQFQAIRMPRLNPPHVSYSVRIDLSSWELSIPGAQAKARRYLREPIPRHRLKGNPKKQQLLEAIQTLWVRGSRHQSAWQKVFGWTGHDTEVGA
jgi:hypothetical protein